MTRLKTLPPLLVALAALSWGCASPSEAPLPATDAGAAIPVESPAAAFELAGVWELHTMKTVTKRVPIGATVGGVFADVSYDTVEEEVPHDEDLTIAADGTYTWVLNGETVNGTLKRQEVPFSDTASELDTSLNYWAIERDDETFLVYYETLYDHLTIARFDATKTYDYRPSNRTLRKKNT